LLFLFLKDEEIFYLGQLVSGFYSGWAQAIPYWDRVYPLTTSIDKELMATAQTKSSFTFSVTTGSGPHLFSLSGLRNEKAGQVGLEINNQKYQIGLNSENELGFQWQTFSLGELPKGRQTVRVDSLSGENYLGPMVILAQERYEEIRKKAGKLLSTNDVVMLLEAEKLTENKKKVLVEDQASGGQAVSGNLSFNVDPPRVGDYQFRLRLKPTSCPGVGTVILQNSLNHSQLQRRIFCGHDYRSEDLGEMNLRAGGNELRLSLKGQMIIDQIIMTKGESFPEVGWRRVDYKRQNPAKYVIEAPSQIGQSYFINFAENFSNKWQLSNGQTQFRPIKSYGFGNLYYVQNKNGQGKRLTLEYSDQKYLTIGLLITLLGYIILGLLFFFCFLKIEKLKRFLKGLFTFYLFILFLSNKG
jgi:hypothetical protein